mmetsp:Transcript_8772/g.14941  ORF Transcript_8772/g.14941 Transcript_8772/m.14941 type:complete len:288 (+) Transcript_8772:105-968(+)|eukprot:CAMPEP_0114431324 /NCGR_PEP_ID=MMETSP0103-20121206/10540_1 /TAXON_ID=37642 ORGANISM="Paraphysomonas imperforata, Strain PA2" /NCGR_SAMPLE_ID=MMETSP0103 /ASSEMBLY_ACC=CAM_ASM_000201 /LENGTH=287 /DNA_ID=CAMNT_0001600883 /DNA_START=95 /DNA_END=958 /DNA_ORIENTATION=-
MTNATVVPVIENNDSKQPVDSTQPIGNTQPGGEGSTAAPNKIVKRLHSRSDSVIEMQSPNDSHDKLIDDDITLFEAWFEVLTKNDRGDKVSVEEMVDKVASSGMLTFSSSTSAVIRSMETKNVKEELLDLIEDDLGLNVLDWISINKFFSVIIRSPRYLYRLQRAAGDESPPPKVFVKPGPKNSADIPEIDSDNDDLDPFEETVQDKALDKHVRRVTWKESFKNLFSRNDKKNDKKKAPRRMLSKQSSSFYDKCESFRRSILGKSSAVKVYAKPKEGDDDDTDDCLS